MKKLKRQPKYSIDYMLNLTDKQGLHRKLFNTKTEVNNLEKTSGFTVIGFNLCHFDFYNVFNIETTNLGYFTRLVNFLGTDTVVGFIVAHKTCTFAEVREKAKV